MRRTLLMIVILMLIGCNNGGGDDDSTTPMIQQSVIRPNYYEKEPDPIIIYLDDLSFSEAFRIEHRAKGEGQTFWWIGKEYTTNRLVSTERN